MESQVEEDMLELTLTRYLADPARTSVQEQFSGGDTVGKLVARLKEIFHISESTKFRVWHHYTVNIGDLLTSSRMTLKDAGLTSEQTIVLEERSEAGKWSIKSREKIEQSVAAIAAKRAAAKKEEKKKRETLQDEELVALRDELGTKITKYEESPHYVKFMKDLVERCCQQCDTEDLRKISKALTTMAEEKQNKGTKTKKLKPSLPKTVAGKGARSLEMKQGYDLIHNNDDNDDESDTDYTTYSSRDGFVLDDSYHYKDDSDATPDE